MQSFVQTKSVKILVSFVLVCFTACQLMTPIDAYAASAADDLKKIEYKYYFRGNYEKAINELRTFLERADLDPSQVVEAREFLAASLILSGNAEAGKDEYLKLLQTDSSYNGPDPAVFKPVIVASFDEAKSEYAALVIRSVPDATASTGASSTTEATEKPGKPIYKKWWFYATMAAVLVVVAGAAGSGGDEAAPARDTGTVTVEVNVP